MSGEGPEELQAELEAWTERGLRRELRLPQGIDFTSNDYLGLSRDPRLQRAAKRAIDSYGAGSPSSRLLRGHVPAHRDVERAAAAWQGTQAALLFPSGYQANLALLSVLSGARDVIFSDSLIHASLIDGCRLSRAAVEIFAHNDVQDLERLLRRSVKAHRRLIVVEAVYSMEGDRAPLEAYHHLARQYDAWLIVDEAHAAGLYGLRGAGCVSELAQRDRVLARTITGGKALGVAAGFVAASQAVVDSLVNRGRSFIYTTASPPATAAALQAAIEVVAGDSRPRQHALAMAKRLRATLQKAGLPALGESAIVPVVIGGSERAMSVAEKVSAAGFDARAVRPPTVPEGSSRIRIVCHANRTVEEIDALASALVAAYHGAKTTPAPDTVRVSGKAGTARLIVTGTDTDVGKTVVSALLMRDLLRRDVPARYLKPVQTGLDSDTETVRRLADLPESCVSEPVIALSKPASIDQAAREAGVSVAVSEVTEGIHERLASGERAHWLLETAGGVLVPFSDREDQADLLAMLAMPTVLVARTALGTLNHTRLSIETMQRRGLTVRGVFLVGPPHPENIATLKTWLDGLPIVHLDVLDPLDSTSLDRWLDAHALEFLWR